MFWPPRPKSLDNGYYCFGYPYGHRKPKQSPVSERDLRVNPLLRHIADELIESLSAHPGQAMASRRASAIKVRRLSEAVPCSSAVALLWGRLRDHRIETKEPAALQRARVVVSRKNKHG